MMLIQTDGMQTEERATKYFLYDKQRIETGWPKNLLLDIGILAKDDVLGTSENLPEDIEYTISFFAVHLLTCNERKIMLNLYVKGMSFAQVEEETHFSHQGIWTSRARILNKMLDYCIFFQLGICKAIKNGYSNMLNTFDDDKSLEILSFLEEFQKYASRSKFPLNFLEAAFKTSICDFPSDTETSLQYILTDHEFSIVQDYYKFNMPNKLIMKRRNMCYSGIAKIKQRCLNRVKYYEPFLMIGRENFLAEFCPNGVWSYGCLNAAIQNLFGSSDIKVLQLNPSIESILRNAGFVSVSDFINAEDTIVSIHGIGTDNLNIIRKRLEMFGV